MRDVDVADVARTAHRGLSGAAGRSATDGHADDAAPVATGARAPLRHNAGVLNMNRTLVASVALLCVVGLVIGIFVSLL